MELSLYEIQSEYLALLDMADEDEQIFIDTLESITGELEVKADNYGIVIDSLSTKIAQLDKEIKRLTDKKTIIKNNIDHMKDRLKTALETMDKKSIETEHYKFTVCKNGGVQPIEVNEDIVPDSFKRIILETDKDKIRKSLEAGEKLDFATLKERGTHLRIK